MSESRAEVACGPTIHERPPLAQPHQPGGADLFVCEVTDLSIYDARMAKAKEAGVKTLILSHLVPGAIGNAVAGFSDAAYIEDVRKHFGGDVIAGRDQMVM